MKMKVLNLKISLLLCPLRTPVARKKKHIPYNFIWLRSDTCTVFHEDISKIKIFILIRYLLCTSKNNFFRLFFFSFFFFVLVDCIIFVASLLIFFQNIWLLWRFLWCLLCVITDLIMITYFEKKLIVYLLFFDISVGN